MSKIKRFYLLLIVVSVLMTSYGVCKRMFVEKDYDRYEMYIALQDLKMFASRENKDLLEVTRNFLNAGMHTVIIEEATIESLKQSEEYQLGVTYSGLNLNLHADRELLAFIERGIKRTIKDDRKIYYKDEHTLVIEGRLSDLINVNVSSQANLKISGVEKLGLGYIEEELEMLKHAGIRFALRPMYDPKLQDGAKAIDVYFSYVAKYSPDQGVVLFGGSDILGGEENIAYLREKLEQSQLVPVVVENAQQDGNFQPDGLLPLIKSMDFKTIRLFSTWLFIQNRYDYRIAGHHHGEEIINTYYRAITERNVRLIYFRFFLTSGNEPVTDMDIYQKRFSELEHRLYRNYGILPVIRDGVYTPLNTMKHFALSKKIKIFAIFGTLVACLFLAEEFIGKHRRIRYALWGLSFLALLASAVLYREKSEQMFALLASIVFPTLSVVYLMRVLKSYRASDRTSCKASDTHDEASDKASCEIPGAKSLKKSCNYCAYLKGIFHLFVCMSISFVGAVFVVNLYADSKYMFEFSKFVGVKASQMIPLFAVIIMYFAVIGINLSKWYGETPVAGGATGVATDVTLSNSSAASAMTSNGAAVTSNLGTLPNTAAAPSTAACGSVHPTAGVSLPVRDQIKMILQQNVKVWQALLALVVLGLLAIMLLRSGHTSNVEPPSFELWFRNLLELITPARPRTKAIFLGFPALILLVFMANKRIYKISYPLFLIAATIGQANLVNSFSHIRTPILVSLYRILGEFVVSALLVLIVVVLFDIAESVYRRMRKDA